MEIKLDSLDFDKLTLRDKSNNVQEISIREELKIDEFNMQKEFLNQSGKYAYWANLLEIVRHHFEAESIKLEKQGSMLNLTIRQQLEKQGKKPTKDMIESAIYLDEGYQKQLQEVKNWEYRTKQLQYIVKAFENRTMMLTQIGADLRKTNANGGITNTFSH